MHEDNKEELKQTILRREQKLIEEKRQISKPLAHSNQILQQANDRTIDEMYRLLVAAQKAIDIKSNFFFVFFFFVSTDIT